ncbi:Uncharacterised protein [Halioglobus japonicus]|nr:Uncharacterised protein [Halioglobus japonicus]
MYAIMLLRLFAGPTGLFLLGIVAWGFFAIILPSHFAGSAVLSQVAESLSGIAMPAGAVISLAALTWAGMQTHVLWQWHRGEGDFCWRCSGVLAQRHGRYGAYLKCIACGATKKGMR